MWTTFLLTGWFFRWWFFRWWFFFQCFFHGDIYCGDFFPIPHPPSRSGYANPSLSNIFWQLYSCNLYKSKNHHLTITNVCASLQLCNWCTNVGIWVLTSNQYNVHWVTVSNTHCVTTNWFDRQITRAHWKCSNSTFLKQLYKRDVMS